MNRNNNDENSTRIGERQSRKEADHVAAGNQLDILTTFGTIDFDPAYDYKAARKRERRLLDRRLSAFICG